MIFKVKEKVLGKKQASAVPTQIKNPVSGKEETEPKKIKDTCVQYCKKLLTNRLPKEEYVEDINSKHKAHEIVMKTVVEEEDNVLNRTKFESSWNVLKKTKKEKYNFIFNGGDALKEALFKLFCTVWKTEICPTLWNKT